MPERVHAVHNGYCATRPQPGDLLTDGCPDCGHAFVLHAGTNHCPVCEMVDLNRQLAEIVRGGPHQAITRAMAYEIASAFPPGHFAR